MGHLLYLMFRCDFDVIESLESLEKWEGSEHSPSPPSAAAVAAAWTGQCAWRLGTVVVASPCRRACRVRAWQLAASSSPFPAAGALPHAFARSRAGQKEGSLLDTSWTS